MDKKDREKKRNFEESALDDPAESKEAGERSPRQRQRSEQYHQSSSLTSFLADDHQRSRQLAFGPSEYPRLGHFGQQQPEPFQHVFFPAGRAGQGFDGQPHQLRRSNTEDDHDDAFRSDDVDYESSTDPRFDPFDLAWAEAERRLEHDISSIQPLPILPPFEESRLLPLDRLLDTMTSEPRERSHSTDSFDLRERLGRPARERPDRSITFPPGVRPPNARSFTDETFSSTGNMDPRGEYRPSAIASYDLSSGSARRYDVAPPVQQALPTSGFARMPSMSLPMPSHRHIFQGHAGATQAIAPRQTTLLRQNSDGGYVIPVTAPNDRLAMTPYQYILRESMEYFTAVEDDVNTTVQGRRKPVLPGQLGIRCRYCSHLPVAGRMRAAVYYPRSLMNLYQGAQNIASVHFQQCTEFPDSVFKRLQEEKPRRDFSKVGKPYWAETCRQLGIYEEDNALWLRTNTQSTQDDESKPSARGGL